MRRIDHVRLPSPISDEDSDLHWQLTLDNQDILCSIKPMDKDTGSSNESWDGDWLSPMAIDLQINGGLGLAFTQLSIQEMPRLLEFLDFLWEEGVESICPTFVRP